MSFHAIVAQRADSGAISASIETLEEAVLGDGDVTVAVEWSNLNFKDAIAYVSPLIIQKFPLIPGIDFAGTVEQSTDPRFAPGDRVVATGWGLSQTHNGGYAQRARVKSDWLVKLPEQISTRDAMAIGTAGFTSMLSVLALEHGGITPARGDVVVTGASGGVGSIAIAILAKLGYRVIASSGKTEENAYLSALGASEILDRAELAVDAPPLGAERWAAGIDTVGSKTLANLIAHTKYRGVVTTCGFVGGMDLPVSVRPFILRNVTLAGIDSVNCPQPIREEAWRRLASDLDLTKLQSTITEIGLGEVLEAASRMREGKIRGRTVIDVNR
ncbi:MDR family oxidoreductase [Sphingomonas kyeonggiensis]|uniref:Acrylyl-CoA reductase (NADPH) n=1 Tax=Sphingomonas kyeonggiensis TaxID=1268553 RepID=A0A7W6JT32_9SPHN|nr:MDR family oxidoreductase [Sphingomonas kyeonggiensis]MBB4097966.1 acrylyl-CoA reductase (NADPH) [Sphingomonas kyeonggiensis]